MAGWFEGEKIGGDFLVRVNQTAENCELILGTMMGFVSQLIEFLGLAPISAQTGISEKNIETLFSQNQIFNTNSRDNDKNNIKFMIEELPLAEISVLDQEILLRVMTQNLLCKMMEQQIELPEQKGCTLLLCAEEKTLMKALELARQLREEGFAVAVMQKQDHKQEAEYLGAEFIAHLTEQEVLNGMILVSTQRSDRIDEVSISGRGLTDYIYERTMSQAMQDVEESLNADTSTYDFTKGFSLF